MKFIKASLGWNFSFVKEFSDDAVVEKEAIEKMNEWMRRKRREERERSMRGREKKRENQWMNEKKERIIVMERLKVKERE